MSDKSLLNYAERNVSYALVLVLFSNFPVWAEILGECSEFRHYGFDLFMLKKKNKAAVNLKTVLRFTAALFFLLKLFSSHIYCIPNYVKELFTGELRCFRL